jgi:drug/metabolite transporter (DMT)-like permease
VIPAQLLGILSAMASAVVWGSGDFAGGYASRRNAPVFVLMLASLSGLIAFGALAALTAEPIPDAATIMWSFLAGLAGGLGLVAFYRALAVGPAALVAPTAAVVGAGIPVVFAFLHEGLPAPTQLAGLALGLVGIWLVSSGANRTASASRSSLWLAVAAGLGFGSFFVLISRISPGSLFVPLGVTRVAELGLAASLFLVQRRSLPPQPLRALPFAVGLLDAGGNIFYLLSVQVLRLDVAAVISSMYPGITVLLAGILQKEQVGRLQMAGIALCLAAVSLIAFA